MLCRSQAATAVCVPGDARSMVVARRAAGDGAARALHDVRYARLGGSTAAEGGGRRSASSRRLAAPTRDRQQAATAAPPPPPPAVVVSGGAASCKPRVEMARRRPAARAPVAVTLPMVTKSPSKEAPAKDLAEAAKRAAAAVAAPGDQVLQVRNVTDV